MTTPLPFQPIGPISRRQMAIDYLGRQPEGTVVTYDDLREELGTDRPTVQGVVNAAKPGLERQHRKAVVAVRGVGYRVVHANEHLTVARTHQKKSFRQLGKSRSVLDYVDFSKVTEGEKTSILLAATSIGLQLDYMRRNDIRSTRIEAAVEKVTSAAERSETELSEIRERLERLEQIRSETANG